MQWTKKGVIFAPNGQYDWMISHASIPVVDTIDAQTVRVYFGARDKQNRSRIGYVDLDPDDLTHVLKVSAEPVLPLGPIGTFDDNGMMPSCLLDHQGQKYLYYIGWNPQVTVSYRLAIGLAISSDQGTTFHKYSPGPICDRDLDEPFFNTTPFVRIENGLWRMWYVSCTGWEIINNWPEPRYNIKYAESADGIHWKRTGITCIDYDPFTQAICSPFVVRADHKYSMIYSYRSAHDYRTDPTKGYRLGYAESLDGLNWERKDDEIGITFSEDGWDSAMMEYASIFEHRGKMLLFYNGNGFGKSGFGYAELTHGGS